MKKHRVAILADFPLKALEGASGRGGGQASTWLPQLASAFEARPDLDVHWLVLDRTSRRHRSVEALGQHFHRVPSLPFSANLALRYLPARWSFRRVLGRIRPDVIHAWGAEQIYPAALQDFNGPGVFSLNGALNHYRKIGGLPDDWRWRTMVSSEAGFVKAATVVTAESPWARERIMELDPAADCRVVEYGVHRRFFDTPWRPDPDDPYALYVGGGGHRKGTDVLYGALARMGPRNWRMCFAGDEALRLEVERSGAPGCEYLGMLAWDRLTEALSKAWCVVVPTRADTGPTVVKEARVVGVPVIGTVNGGLRDYVRSGVNGLTVDPLDEEHLVRALDDVMGSFARAEALGKGRHEEDRADFDPDLTAARLASIYHEVASTGGGREC
ncbi:glycosyltransferase group 1 family [Haloferula helveola]|uniref:Glycosyltransferase group 1 family n=1 Tax=Haloferula helveola TaxID=490095 RepID=A0ABM7REA9_9BACT|nr:glycosyltransferase group 1 family [Haloferula helveola]